jgi:heptosyltransferase III
VERTVHTAEHLASAMFWLGVERAEIPRAKLIPQNRQQQRPLAVIHPVASNAEKTWRADGFLAVAEHLSATGTEPVFIGAAATDLAPFREFRTLASAPLEEIKSLLSSASLFIGNDSGPAHMAAAFGLPVVVIFGDSDPAIWGPWRTAAEVVASPAGIGSVTIEQVLSATARLRVHA